MLRRFGYVKKINFEIHLKANMSAQVGKLPSRPICHDQICGRPKKKLGQRNPQSPGVYDSIIVCW